MSNPFDDYKDKVKYDYIIRGKLPYILDEGNIDQQSYALMDIVKEIESLLEDEDYIKESFEEVGLGRVYPKLENEDPTIDILFGISKIDAEKELNIEDLKADVIEFMNVIDSNIDGSSQSGVSHNDPEVEDVEPCIVNLKRDKSKPTEAELIYPKKEESINLDDIDKKLVSEGKLIFRKEESNKSIVLSDDGMIELYGNSELLNSLPFSKLGLIRECKSIIQQGYKFEESTIVSNNNLSNDIDVAQSKKDLEQNIKDVDELQKLKDELDDKVDKLVNESKVTDGYIELDKRLDELIANNATDKELDDFLNEASFNEVITNQEYANLQKKAQDIRRIDIKFPSTEFTRKKLTPEEMSSIDLKNNLTDEQIDYINTKMSKSKNNEGSKNVEELEWYLKNDFSKLFYPDLKDEPISSIDDYINGINNVRKEFNNE